MGRVITLLSSLELSPTGPQCRRIAMQCMRLGIKEPLEEGVSTRREARNLIYRQKRKLEVKK